jgi:hypothetical protein
MRRPRSSRAKPFSSQFNRKICSMARIALERSWKEGDMDLQRSMNGCFIANSTNSLACAFVKRIRLLARGCERTPSLVVSVCHSYVSSSLSLVLASGTRTSYLNDGDPNHQNQLTLPCLILWRRLHSRGHFSLPTVYTCTGGGMVWIVLCKSSVGQGTRIAPIFQRCGGGGWWG